MKKEILIKIIITIIISLITFNKVKAIEMYENSVNVKINYSLYKKLSEIYSEEYVEFLEQKRLDEIKNNNLENVIVNEIPIYTIPFSSSHTTSYKSLKIIKNGSTVTLILNWLKMPATRSYDVIGFRFVNLNLKGEYLFKQIYTTDSQTIVKTKHFVQKYNNGFGISFPLINENVKNINIYVDFTVNGSGTIYGTYQHAQKNISLSNSQKYTISADGYGNVLKFDTSIKNIYDAMGGVNIKI